MSRRKKSGADELIDLIAMLPWWAGVVLAVGFYFVLHRLAAQPVSLDVQHGQAGTFALQYIWRGFATVGQYILPLICLAGAGVSALKRRERKTLVQDVVKSKSADVLDGMSWTQFEKLVGEAFRLQGYSVTETGGGGADGGVDLVLSRGGEKHLVQCKQWKAYRVGVDVVRELYGVMAARGAASGFVVTSGRFTDDATSFASGRNLTLIDGPKLHGMIHQAQASSRSETASTPASVRQAPPPSVSSTPSCPLCSKPMIMRKVRRGANAGVGFWGCSGYPGCKGTRDAT